MHSVQLRKTLFTLWSSCLEIVVPSRHALIAHQTPIFWSQKGSSSTNPGLSALQYRLSWEFTSPPRKTRPHQRKTLTVDQLLHRVQTEETNCKNVLLQPDHVPSKHELPMPYTVAVVTILWPLVQTFSKHSSPEPRSFPRHIPADSCLKYSYTKNIGCSTVYPNRVTSLKDWEMHLLATNPMIHSASLLSPTAEVTLRFENSAIDLTLHGRVIRRGLWPVHSPGLTPCDLYLWGV
jgi:hypothetical protein